MADENLMTSIGANQPLHQRINGMREAALPEGSRWSDLQTYRRYARGRQRGTLSYQQQQMLMGVIAHKHGDNVSYKVIFERANRIELLRFDVSDQQVSDFLREVFVKCAVADLQADVHFATIRDGNHALGLRWHDLQERPTWHRERWWDGQQGMFVFYGDDGLPSMAVKDWKTGDALRRTVYYDDRIERYIARDGSWDRYTDGSDEWPQPWLKPDGTPLHIPVVHFAAGSDDDTPYGASILDGGVLGLQDEINDVQRDVTMAARMTAFQMYWATGSSPELGDDGKPIPQRVGPGMFIENESPDARYGTFAAGDMSQLIDAHRMKLDTVSRNTGTPLHLITGGDWPSGEALLRAEMPLVGFSHKMIEGVLPSWATAAHRSVEMSNVFGNTNLDEDALITPVFAPPDKRDPLTLAQIDVQKANGLMALQSLGWSNAELQRMWGLSEEQIKKMAAEKKQEQTAAAEAGILPPLQ